MTESGFYEGRIKIMPGLSEKQEIIMDKLIEQLKHNEKPFALNSKEEQKCFEKVGPENCQIQADYCIRWFDCKRMGIDHFGTAGKFRISPDYQSEPQTERCEVGTEGYIKYLRKGACSRRWLHEALSDPDFMHFEYEGRKSVSPRLRPDQGKPADIPKWVVFVK